METKNQLKHRATLLLRKYDKMRRELKALERELHTACQDYSRTAGYIGWFNKDSLRTMLLVEEEQRAKQEMHRLEQAAERDAWERANA